MVPTQQEDTSRSMICLPTISGLRFPRALSAIHDVIERALDSGRHPRGETWRAHPADEHLEHARAHLEKLAVGDVSEPHLAHAACRLLMALEVAEHRKRK